MSNHGKSSNLLQTNGLNMEPMKDFILHKEQVQEKEVETLCHQFFQIPKTTKCDPSILCSENSA